MQLVIFTAIVFAIVDIKKGGVKWGQFQLVDIFNKKIGANIFNFRTFRAGDGTRTRNLLITNQLFKKIF